MIKKLTILGIITMQCLHIIAGGCSSKQQVEAQPRVQPAPRLAGKRASVIKIAAKQRVQFAQNGQREQTDAQRKVAAHKVVKQQKAGFAPSHEENNETLNFLLRKYLVLKDVISSGQPYKLQAWDADTVVLRMFVSEDPELMKLRLYVMETMAKVHAAHLKIVEKQELEKAKLALAKKENKGSGVQPVVKKKQPAKPKQKKQAGKPQKKK